MLWVEQMRGETRAGQRGRCANAWIDDACILQGPKCNGLGTEAIVRRQNGSELAAKRVCARPVLLCQGWSPRACIPVRVIVVGVHATVAASTEVI